MIRRRTQNSAYWNEKFTVTSGDLQYLSTLFLEDELPRTTQELSRELILHHARQEEAIIERALSTGSPYQPKRAYEVGERVVFPALDYRAGEVVNTRPGHNPEYDPFEVIQVAFEDGDTREFVSKFEDDHPLNREMSGDAESGEPLSPEELASVYAPRIVDKLETRLESDPDFVRFAGEWFPRDLLVEVPEGHLIVADAALDMASGGPLSTEALLRDVELPKEISPQLRSFSLNYALKEDERFDEVGPEGEVLWFLRRLKPEGAKYVPRFLQYEPSRDEPGLLTTEMRALEQRLGDEWSDLEPSGEVSEPVEVVLIYPHWRAGSLPLSDRLAHIFPSGHAQPIHCTIVDGDTGEEMSGWVIREGRYVYGLREWYRANDIPVGGRLEVSRGEKPGRIIVRPSNRRFRREWVRAASPTDDGQLVFEMGREDLVCDYDELMVMVTAAPEEMDRIWDRRRKEDLSLGQVIDEIFPELVKLSPQGNVHAATLYSAVNVAMRIPPAPVLEILVTKEEYAPVGDNYWILNSRGDGE